MRALWLVLLVLAALPLAGCESLGAIWSAALWIPGLFLVIIIWLIGYLTIRARGD